MTLASPDLDTKVGWRCCLIRSMLAGRRPRLRFAHFLSFSPALETLRLIMSRCGDRTTATGSAETLVNPLPTLDALR